MKNIKPLNLLQSIGYFGLSALLFRLCVYNLMPALLHHGFAPFWAFIVSYSLPLLVFIATTFVLVAREGNLHRWAARLRFRPLTGRQWFYTVGIFVVSFLVAGLLFPFARFLAMQPALAPPAFLPDLLNPAKTMPAAAFSSFMGVPLKGAYTLLFVYFIFLTFFNILGEELWFRGYILPRRELVWGRRTWIYHGIFWCLFHTPIYPWTIVYLLPTTLAVSFATQRFQNTWAGFIVHYLGNGVLGLLPIIIGVFAK